MKSATTEFEPGEGSTNLKTGEVSWSCLYLYRSICIQSGARTRDPKIKSYKPDHLSQPGAPGWLSWHNCEKKEKTKPEQSLRDLLGALGRVRVPWGLLEEQKRAEGISEETLAQIPQV